MVQFLPLPALWLLFYALGRLPLSGNRHVRGYVIAGVSLAILICVAGFKTGAAFASVGLVLILTGLWLQAQPDGRSRRLAFALSIAMTVLLIAVFLKFRPYAQKYFLAIPSLSYLGFRGIAWLTSAYGRKGVNASSGLLQMFFMPSLFMGPITRVENFQEVRRDYEGVLRRLAFAFPMLIAGKLVNPFVIERPAVAILPWWRYWVGAVANSFELYLTFAGYSHLILGLGLLAGYRLPENFNYPYLSTSIGEFWRRWHMSLSFWIRDYVYIPLGGNRKGILRKCLNMLTAMGICGIWHGLELHYLFWGLFHGVLLAGESVLAHYDLRPLGRLPRAVYVPVKVLVVFALVTFAWLLFKYQVGEVAVYLRRLSPW
jgi:D-alanyl-lipoteichoic acid acyltransferase DltB (MBOAT superfamily)